MQFFKAIFATATMAIAVAASPIAELESRTAPSCAPSFKASCCSSVVDKVVNILSIPVTLPIGNNCIPILSGGTCTQTTACCESTGPQTGLLNVGTVCPQIIA